jgi:trimeric autotransporter adhesin
MKLWGSKGFGLYSILRLAGMLALLLGLVWGAPPAQAAAGTARAQAAQSGGAPQSQPVASLLNADGTLNLNLGFNGALDLRGWQVRLDAQGGPVFKKEAEKAPAATLDSPWSAFPDGGLNSVVDCLAALDANVFAGGLFTGSTGGMNILSRVAVLNGASWVNQPNGEGLDAEVLAMAVVGNDVYMGGVFDAHTTGTDYVDHIAVYHGSNGTLTALPGGGVNGEVWAFAVQGTNLYVGGLFSRSTADPIVFQLNGVAKYDTVTQAWSALPDYGLSPTLIYAMAVQGNDLYVGGNFTQTSDGVVKNLNHIARYDIQLNTWNPLSGNGLNGKVNALAATPSFLYVGGEFTDIYGSSTNSFGHITMYDGTWHALPYGGLMGRVDVLTAVGNDVYIGGLFTRTTDPLNIITLNHIAKFDGAWHALPNDGLNSPVNAIAVLGNTLYAGGHFSTTADGAVTGLNRIAKLALSATPPVPGAFAKGPPGNGSAEQANHVTLHWSASSGASSYAYCYTSSSTSGCDTSWIDAGSSLSATISGLRYGKTYYWQVSAGNSSGSTEADGAWWSFTTPAGYDVFVPMTKK